MYLFFDKMKKQLMEELAKQYDIDIPMLQTYNFISESFV